VFAKTIFLLDFLSKEKSGGKNKRSLERDGIEGETPV